VTTPAVHHLNCGTMCPWGQRFVNGEGSATAPGRIVCHVLLIELADGLVLVDTGFGTEDIRGPRRLHRGFAAAMRPQLNDAETAISQVQALGFDAGDVRHIVLTHLDIDHAGGLPDFPGADVHVYAREHAVMQSPPVRERVRYAVGSPHWRHGPRWVTHEVGGDAWLGFESVRVLPAGDPEVLMIPLPGHTLGHTGIAVRAGDGWLLHCGDAFFNRHELDPVPSCPPALRAFQVLVQADGRARRSNQERLRELAARHAELDMFCSHDPEQLERARATAVNGP
jgi:glyoxylase-like metal-dependent hydrolase (beta-lactamase superfamily II)